MAKFNSIIFFLFLFQFYFIGSAQFVFETSDFTDDEALVLLDENEFEVLNRNKAKYRHHSIIQINKEGGKKYGNIVVSETKFIKIKEISAKIIDRNGEIVEKKKEKDFKKYPFAEGYILYDDTNYKWYDLVYTSFPYIIEYSYELEMSSLFFWPDWTPQMDIPVLESSYKLAIDNAIKFNTYSIGDMPEPIINSLGGRDIYFWKVDSLEPKIDEDWMPPENETQMKLLLASNDFELANYEGKLNTWNEFGNWYNDLVKDRYNLKNDIREKIRRLVDKNDSEKEKVKKLYSFLQQHTRYVAILLNIGGWQPHLANSVYDNKYGDCKDLSTLMISMLKEVGIKSYPALIKTRDNGVLIKEFPSSQFNHLITFVPLTNDTMWLECTSDYLAAGELPSLDEGCEVLVIKDEGGEIVRTPQSKSDENRWISKIEGRLIPNGTFEFSGSIITKGNYSHYFRNKLISSKPTEQKEWLQKVLGKYAPKVIIEDFSIDNLSEAFHLPLTINFKGIIEKFSSKSASRLFFNPNIIDRVTSSDIPDEKERKFPVHHQYAYMDIDSLIIELPFMYEVEAKPEMIDLQYDFCGFTNSFSIEKSRLIYVRRFDLKKQQIPVSEYTQFIEMFNLISRIDHSKFVLIPK